jgi:hypothetical protein
MDYTTIIKSAVSSIIIILCCYIYLKTDRIYRLSSHKGIKSFRDAFIFFAIAFAANIGVVFVKAYPDQVILLIGLHILFNYSLAMGGFYLVYSLVWKDLGADWQYVLHAAALAVAAIDFYLIKNATFVTQLILLAYGMMMSFSSYREGKQPMRQLLFIALAIAFLGYMVNFASVFLTPYFPYFWLFAYIITLAAFVVLSLAVAKSLGGRHG